jgi:hypothetical protein
LNNFLYTFASVFTTGNTQQRYVNTFKQFRDLNSNNKLSFRTIHSIACLFCNRLFSLSYNTTSTALCILGGGAFQPTEPTTNKRKRFPFSTKIFFSLFFISILYRTCCMMLKQQHTGLFNTTILLFERCLSTIKPNIFTTKLCLSTTKRYIIWYKRCFFLFKRCLPTTKPNIFTTKPCLSTIKRYIIWYKGCFFLFKRHLSTTKPNIFIMKPCLWATKRYIIWFEGYFFLFKRFNFAQPEKGASSQTLRPSDTSLIGRNLRVTRLLQSLSFGEGFRERSLKRLNLNDIERMLSNRLTMPQNNKTNEQPIINHITNSLQFSLSSINI